MEKWPYSNVPVYVVCPRDGGGHSQPLHRNYLLPISPNLEQDKMDKPVAGARDDTSPTPAPSVSDTSVGAELSGTVGQCISLYIVFCLCTALWEGCSVRCTLPITANVC